MENKNKNPKYSFQEMSVSLNTIIRAIKGDTTQNDRF